MVAGGCSLRLILTVHALLRTDPPYLAEGGVGLDDVLEELGQHLADAGGRIHLFLRVVWLGEETAVCEWLVDRLNVLGGMIGGERCDGEWSDVLQRLCCRLIERGSMHAPPRPLASQLPPH